MMAPKMMAPKMMVPQMTVTQMMAPMATSAVAMAAPNATEDVAYMAAPTESPTTVAQTTTTTTTTTTPPTGPEELTSYLDLTSSQEISGEWTIDSLNLYLTPSQLSDIQQIS